MGQRLVKETGKLSQGKTWSWHHPLGNPNAGGPGRTPSGAEGRVKLPSLWGEPEVNPEGKGRIHSTPCGRP